MSSRSCHVLLYGSDFSARSRVRGHLELYCAYLPDTQQDAPMPPIATAEEDAPIDDREWEIVSEGREETPAQVSILDLYISTSSNLSDFILRL